MKTIITLLTAAVIIILVNTAFAQTYQDVVTLKNGSVIRGTIIETSPNESIKIKTKDGSVFVYKMDEIEKYGKEEIKKEEIKVDNDEESYTPEKNKKLGSLGFRKGKSYFSILGGYAWGPAVGAGYEYALSDMIGLCVDLSYSWYSQSFPSYDPVTFLPTTVDIKYTLIGGLVSASFHFMPGKKFDPFIKAGVGYFSWSNDASSSSISAAQVSGVGYGGQLGFNYFLSNSMAIRLQFGWPFYGSGGVTFKF